MLFFKKLSSFSIDMLELTFACLFEKYGLHLSQKGFELVATFIFPKYSFLCFLLAKFNYQITLFFIFG